MANYSVEGKLGTGKTKFCVWRARTALRKGLRVATNIDLDLGALVPELHGARYSRIPDKPTAADLKAIGHGNPASYDEEKNGILILDELGSWLNTRSFQDKGRMPVIDWLIHARKHGWDVYFIVQGAAMIDVQVRDNLLEYQCKCRRLDKVKIPGLGTILGIFNSRLGYLPRMHQVVSSIGEGAGLIVADRWNFRGDDLHAAYDTRQIFSEYLPEDEMKDGYPHGYFSRAYSGLHSAYFARTVPPPGWRERMGAFFRAPVRPAPIAKPKHHLVVLCERLPERDRIKHIRRLTALGAL